jgi:chorismate mutase
MFPAGPAQKAKLNEEQPPDSPIGERLLTQAFKKERVELIRLLVVGTLWVAVLQGGTFASAQTTCSVTHTGSKVAKGTSGGNSLTGLIEQRLSLMTDVARAKWNNGSAIEDPVREQQLLTDVGSKAQPLGLPAEWAQHFFRLQIEAAKEVQYCLFAQWTAARQKPFPEVQDLRTTIRPELDRLTVELLQELARQWPQLSTRGLPEQNALRSAQSTNEIATHLAFLPLSDGSVQSYRHVHAAETPQ